MRGPLLNTSSDVHIGFEFNQGSSPCPAGSSLIQRTEGDILLVYNFTQGGSPSIAYATWHNGAWTAETTLSASIAEAGLFSTDNASTQDDLKPSGAPNPKTDEFGEAGIDLTAATANLGTITGKACEKFGHAFGESRTSGSSTSAQMKDLLGVNIDVSNCVTPTVSTTLKNAAGDGTIDNGSSVDLGSSVYDTAMLGNLVTGKTPTGTVKYTFFTNGDCSGDGTAAGTVTLDGSGNVPQSDTEGPLAAGDYSFEAQYFSGDDPNYTDSDVSACEPFSVSKASSSTATVVKDHAGNVVDNGQHPAALGTKVHDTATVSSGNGSFTPSGSVTYQLYSGLDCQQGNEVGGSEQVAMSGGLVPDSSETAPLQAGSYSYQAVYSGDGNFLGSTGACEPVSVSKASSGTATVVRTMPGMWSITGSIRRRWGRRCMTRPRSRVGMGASRLRAR